MKTYTLRPDAQDRSRVSDAEIAPAVAAAMWEPGYLLPEPGD